MSENSKIPWTDASWNPIRYLDGWMCTKVSAGCLRCYAETFNGRFGNKLPYQGPSHLFPGIGFRLDEQVLYKPLHWRKPRRIFVQSMGDLFHEDVPDIFIDRIFAVMALCPDHTFLSLTKRPERMIKWFGRSREYLWKKFIMPEVDKIHSPWQSPCRYWWPLANLQLGVTIENQEMADKRIPHLLKVSAAVRFVSVEPMLGPINLERLETNQTWPFKAETEKIDALRGHGCSARLGDPSGLKFYDRSLKKIDWVIIGCESGPGRRPCKLEWVRDLIEQCDAADVPVFVKQLDLNGKVSKNPAEWPEWARRREYPKKGCY